MTDPHNSDESDGAPPGEPDSSAGSPDQPGKASAGPNRWGPLLWLLAGVGLALLVVRLSDGGDDRPARPVPTTTVPTARPIASTTQARFAALYLQYLTQDYYAPSHGFCRPLLEKICMALVHAELLQSKRSCEVLPSNAFILAVGRYQLEVGLPVDGKAGPGTVRLLLGGSYNNLRSMNEAFCAAQLPDAGIGDASRAP
ncbi:MAG: hypothetical protein JRI68_25380 [Deltaproteobacteria bacterium]|nr:hypothetical protein [Deltaproteobacteria bacterium]